MSDESESELEQSSFSVREQVVDELDEMLPDSYGAVDLLSQADAWYSTEIVMDEVQVRINYDALREMTDYKPLVADGGEEVEAAIDRRDGESDMVTFERIGKPDPRFRVEQVGADPDIRYRYDWPDRGEPTPEQFERVGHLEVKLVTMLNDLDGDAEVAGDAAHEAIVELREAMMDQRDLDGEQRRQVALGNLEALPEVDRHVE